MQAEIATARAQVGAGIAASVALASVVLASIGIVVSQGASWPRILQQAFVAISLGRTRSQLSSDCRDLQEQFQHQA